MAYETPIDELDSYVPETDGTTGVYTIVKKSTWDVPKKVEYTEGVNSEALPTSVILGSALLPSTGWTATGWTGGLAVGFTHTAGNTSVLSNTVAAIIDNTYQIDLVVTGRTAGTFTVGFGGLTSVALSATDSFSVLAISNANLQITPTSDFNGTIVISIKQIVWGLTEAEILAILGKTSIYGQSEVDSLLALKVATVTGKSLLSDTEIARLLTIASPYTITLQAGADLATKIANSTETTHYPTGWVLEAVDSVNLKITHGLGKRFIGLNVFGKVGAVETLLKPWSEAYTNVIAETTSILKIYGIDPVNEITIIDLNFKQ